MGQGGRVGLLGSADVLPLLARAGLRKETEVSFNGAIPAGLCDCDALSWSSAHPRPHDPALCARWRAMVVSPQDARELREWIGEDQP